MFKIQRVSNGNIVFKLSGHIEAEHLSELQKVLNDESASTGIVLDMKELVLVDHTVAEFLARCEAAGMTLENCPGFVPKWVDRVKGETK
jgi:anti-anti-sigma regulatory factor